MKTTLRLENKIYELPFLPRRKVDKQDITDRQWDNLLKSGNGTGGGTTIEDVVMKYLKKHYTNIIRSKQTSEWDFIFTDGDDKVEVRKVSNKNTTNLTNTSHNLHKRNWEVKAGQLNNGGYILAKILESGIFLLYVPAKLLLNSPHEFSNQISFRQIYKYFGKNILFMIEKYTN